MKTHRQPAGTPYTLCCSKTVQELPIKDRITIRPENVTCKGPHHPRKGFLK